MEVYEPQEDSYFFAEFLKEYLIKNSPKKILDMGCGSGILGKTLSEVTPNSKILCADINPFAVESTKSLGLNTVRSNLFSNISLEERFDLILFNAPYLPEEDIEPSESKLITTGGKRGDEVSLEFLRQAKTHLEKDGKILLLVSSLTPLDKIKKFKPKQVASKKIFFEELKILEFKQ